MKKYRLIMTIIALIIALAFSGCSSNNDADADISDKLIKVGVSIVPEEAFVKAVGGDKVSLVTMIPPGSSPANYGPTPKEMAALEEADIYFAIGVNAELENILPTVAVSGRTKTIYLSEEVENVYPSRFFEEDSHEAEGEEEHEDGTEEEHDHSGRDPHIWMSPKRVIEMVKVIERELSVIDPENKDYYVANRDKYIEELKELDIYIKEAEKESGIKTFIIYHPSLGYLADDYGLNMISIENDGKEATIEDLKTVISLSEEEGIKNILYQSEFDSKQAKILANEVDGEAIMVEPLSADYIENAKKIVDVIFNVGH